MTDKSHGKSDHCSSTNRSVLARLASAAQEITPAEITPAQLAGLRQQVADGTLPIDSRLIARHLLLEASL